MEISKGDRVRNPRRPSRAGTATTGEYTDGNLGIRCVSVLWDGGKRAVPNFRANLEIVPAQSARAEGSAA